MFAIGAATPCMKKKKKCDSSLARSSAHARQCVIFLRISSYARLRIRPNKSVSSGAREDNIAVVTPDQFVAGDNKVKVEG